MKAQILAKIESIPPLPETVRQIELIVHDETKNFADVKNVVERDPVVMAEILRKANAPYYGFRREIASVQQAISLFGLGTIRGFVLSVASRNSFQFDLSPYGLSDLDFSRANDRHLALVVNWLKRSRLGAKKLFQLSPAAFMIDIGKLLIAQVLIEQRKTEAFQAECARQPDILHAEKAFCGMDSIDVTATIFRQWDFEPELVQLIYYAKDPEQAPEPIAESAKTLRTVYECVEADGSISEQSRARALALVGRFGLDEESFLKALEVTTENDAR